MSRNKCWIEVDDKGNPIRVFRHRVDAFLSPAFNEDRVKEWPRYDAVHSIRKQVYDRANGQCEKCGKRLTWKQMHMDEKVARGNGGEISVGNSWVLCANCHILDIDSEHGNRRWQS